MRGPIGRTTLKIVMDTSDRTLVATNDIGTLEYAIEPTLLQTGQSCDMCSNSSLQTGKKLRARLKETISLHR